MNLGLDPTQVDWNDPSVEYLLKYTVKEKSVDKTQNFALI